MNSEFKKYIRSQKVTPPTEAWVGIEKSLNQKKQKKKFSYLGILLLAALLVPLFIYIYNSQTTQVELPINKKELTLKPKIEKSSSDIKPKTEKNTNTLKILDNKINTAKLVQSSLKSVKKNTVRNQKRNSKKVDFSENEKFQSLRFSDVPITQNFELNSTQSRNIEKSSYDSLESTSEVPIVRISKEIDFVSDEKNSNDSIPLTKNSFTEVTLDVDTLENMKIKSSIPDVSKSKSSTKWEATAFVAPSYARSASDGNIWLVDLKEYNGQYKASTNFGINLKYKINSKWSARVGIGKVSLQQQAKNVVILPDVQASYSLSDIDYISNMAIVNGAFINSNTSVAPISRVNVNQSISYLSIPLSVGYEFYNSKTLGLSAFVGSASNFLLQNSIYYEREGSETPIGIAKNLNKFALGTQLGIQTQFKFSKKLGFSFEPQLLYFYNFFNQKENVKPYTINLNTGFYYNF